MYLKKNKQVETKNLQDFFINSKVQNSKCTINQRQVKIFM